jgi:ubiquinol-cytochrome c reductase iron-sulfur subunit
MAESGHAQAVGSQEGGTRRDFLVLAATALGAVGAGAVAVPLISSMEPARDTLAAGAPVDIDISHIQPGQQIVVLWRSRPIFIMHRTEEELQKLQAAQHASQLRDPNSGALQQPEYAKNWHRSIKPEILVLVGICTHLGCIPKGQSMSDSRGDYGGWFCPCHGSHYDTAGRIRQGPAPRNLEVPTYEFVSDTKIKIG